MEYCWVSSTMGGNSLRFVSLARARIRTPSGIAWFLSCSFDASTTPQPEKADFYLSSKLFTPSRRPIPGTKFTRCSATPSTTSPLVLRSTTNSGRGLVRSCCSSYPGRISRPGFPIEQSARQSSRFTVVGTRLVDLAFWLRSYRHRILCHIFRRFRHVDEAHRRRGRANYASFRLLRRQTQLGRGKNSSVPCNPRQACGRTAKFMD